MVLITIDVYRPLCHALPHMPTQIMRGIQDRVLTHVSNQVCTAYLHVIGMLREDGNRINCREAVRSRLLVRLFVAEPVVSRWERIPPTVRNLIRMEAGK